MGRQEAECLIQEVWLMVALLFLRGCVTLSGGQAGPGNISGFTVKRLSRQQAQEDGRWSRG